MKRRFERMYRYEIDYTETTLRRNINMGSPFKDLLR